jgi:MIT (microtubule interacting and transport) domain
LNKGHCTHPSKTPPTAMSSGEFLQVISLPWSKAYLQKAIDIVKHAIEEDNKKEYQEAYRLYSQALDYFMIALKCPPPRRF